MAEMIEYRPARIDLRKMYGGAMLLAQTESGQVVIYLTDPQLEILVRQAKNLQPDPGEHNSPKEVDG